MDKLEFLTNDAKYLISAMYQEYLSRRKNNVSKKDAVSFNSVNDIHSKLMPEWNFEDTLFTCKELKKHNLITGTNYGTGEIVLINLSTEAIALLETTFKDKADSVLEFMTKIKNAIPFI